MWKQIEQVRQWHLKFGVPVATVPAIPSRPRVELRNNILLEEVRELHEAETIEEAADAICDVLYVILGTAHEYGIAAALPELFDEVQRSNMSKLDENGNPVRRDDGKILKSSLFTPPNLAPILKQTQY